MTSIRFYYDPISEFNRLFEVALAARFWPRYSACAASTRASSQVAPQCSNALPTLDVHESKDTNTVTATFELPGLKSDRITVDVHHNRLTVSGESPVPDSDNEEENNYIIRERHVGKFFRTLQLPSGTEAEDVKAKMENGVLVITFPKTTPEQKPKRVAIQ